MEWYYRDHTRCIRDSVYQARSYFLVMEDLQWNGIVKVPRNRIEDSQWNIKVSSNTSPR